MFNIVESARLCTGPSRVIDNKLKVINEVLWIESNTLFEQIKQVTCQGNGRVS